MKAPCRVTENFTRNLDDIEALLHESPAAFEDLLSDLFATVIPNLERFPAIGRKPLTTRRRRIIRLKC